jgi:hypothetical protein
MDEEEGVVMKTGIESRVFKVVTERLRGLGVGSWFMSDANMSGGAHNPHRTKFDSRYRRNCDGNNPPRTVQMHADTVGPCRT